MTLESKCEARIQSEIIEPAGATLGLSMHRFRDIAALPPSRLPVVDYQRFSSA